MNFTISPFSMNLCGYELMLVKLEYTLDQNYSYWDIHCFICAILLWIILNSICHLKSSNFYSNM